MSGTVANASRMAVPPRAETASMASAIVSSSAVGPVVDSTAGAERRNDHVVAWAQARGKAPGRRLHHVDAPMQALADVDEEREGRRQ